MKLCEFCGEELSVSEFYTNHNNPDGLATSCKRCMKEHRACNALNEILKHVNFNNSFSKEKLKKSKKSHHTLMSYLHDLTDLGLLEYNESKDTYILILNDTVSTFCKKYEIKSSKIPEKFIDHSIEVNNNDLKVCEVCGKELKSSDNIKEDQIILILNLFVELAQKNRVL